MPYCAKHVQEELVKHIKGRFEYNPNGFYEYGGNTRKKCCYKDCKIMACWELEFDFWDSHF